MDYYRNILITGCSSGLGQALFNKVWEDDILNPLVITELRMEILMR